MWSGEKLKPPTKDTHTLRLNLKSPENRQRYPPDEDLDAIHVISSEYEIATPVQSSIEQDQLASYTKIYNTTHNPRFLPKLKYGAVSKSYLKKLSSIFTQHPPTKTIFLDASQVKLSGVGCDNGGAGGAAMIAPDEDDEGHCSLSEKSSVKNEECGTKVCDTMGGTTSTTSTTTTTTAAAAAAIASGGGSGGGAAAASVVTSVTNKQNVNHNVNHNKSNNVNNNNDNGNRNSDNNGDVDGHDNAAKRGLSGGIAQFSLPRIALNKQQG